MVEHFKEFRLIGFEDGSNYSGGGSFYVPQWRVIAKDGSSFEYIFYGGGIHITG